MGAPEEPGSMAVLVAQLREAKAVAEAADHAKSAFLAAMSHELRTPLTAIIGFSELLEDGTGGPLNERQARYVNNVLSSGRALLDLIDQVLDIAKVEAGRLTLTLSLIDAGELLEDVSMLVRPLAAKKEISLAVTIDPDLPRITADAPKLKQVAFGLLANAVRHSAEGTEVRLTGSPCDPPDGGTGAWVQICVVDTGPGIVPELRDRLLSDFSLQDVRAEGRTGTGVSLALAHRLAQLHGGRLAIESGEGVGTTMRILLPVTARPVGRQTPAEPIDAPEGEGDMPLALVVGDDLQASDLLAQTIEGGGYRVARAYTASQGRMLAARLSPAAITIDPALPDGDGLDLLRELHAAPAFAEVPIVVVSVSAPREDVTRLGAVAWVMKPVNRAELLGVLRRATGQAGLHRHRGAPRP